MADDLAGFERPGLGVVVVISGNVPTQWRLETESSCEAGRVEKWVERAGPKNRRPHAEAHERNMRIWMTSFLTICMNLIIYQLICCVLSPHKTDEGTEDIDFLLKVTCLTRALLKKFFPGTMNLNSWFLLFIL